MKFESSLHIFSQVVLFVAIVPMIRQKVQTNYTSIRITAINASELETFTNYANTTPAPSSRSFAYNECEADKITNFNVSISFSAILQIPFMH